MEPVAKGCMFLLPISRPSKGDFERADSCSKAATAGPLVESFSMRMQSNEG